MSEFVRQAGCLLLQAACAGMVGMLVEARTGSKRSGIIAMVIVAFGIAYFKESRRKRKS